MNILFAASLSFLVTFSAAAPSGIYEAYDVVPSPYGTVRNAGLVSSGGHGLGLGYGVVASSATAPGFGHDLALGQGLGAFTPGGAVIQGPPTASVGVGGSGGRIVADGYWDPSTNSWSDGGWTHGW